MTDNYSCLEIQEISVKDVHDKDRFNSNNHWTNNCRPLDYDQVLSQFELPNWICEHQKSCILINISHQDLHWAYAAYVSGNMMARVPTSCMDDLELFCEKYKDVDQWFMDENGNQKSYFVRTASVSLKHGIHGAGPYTSLKMIMESIITSREGHSPLKDDKNGLTLYLFPWKDIPKDTEFRVFVYKNRITAISQQHCYSSNETLAKLDAEFRPLKMAEWCDKIIAHAPNPSVSDYCYSYDVAILNDGQVYFIEYNCFGQEYAAGSSLFHWIHDHDILYGDGSKIVARYCV